MAGSYPVSFDVERPQKFERAHVFLRLALLILVSMIGSSIGVFTIVYLVFPIVAAIFVAQKGGQRYLDETGPQVTGAIRWVVAILAYLLVLTDRLPGGGAQTVRFEIERSGSPTVGSALLRIIYAIPSAIVLAILGIVSGIIWIIGSIWILFKETYPEGLWKFQRGVLRWEARLLGYLASLVKPYPPFSLDTGSESPAEPPEA